MPDTILMNKPKRERLRKRYKKAVTNGEKKFMFEGYEFDTGYAKYMLEYLDLPSTDAQLPDTDDA